MGGAVRLRPGRKPFAAGVLGDDADDIGAGEAASGTVRGGGELLADVGRSSVFFFDFDRPNPIFLNMVEELSSSSSSPKDADVRSRPMAAAATAIGLLRFLDCCWL